MGNNRDGHLKEESEELKVMSLLGIQWAHLWKSPIKLHNLAFARAFARLDLQKPPYSLLDRGPGGYLLTKKGGHRQYVDLKELST